MYLSDRYYLNHGSNKRKNGAMGVLKRQNVTVFLLGELAIIRHNCHFIQELVYHVTGNISFGHE